MALFGGGNAQQGLALRITESGAEQVTGKLNRLAGATDKVDRAAHRGVGGFTRIGAAMGKLRGVASGLLGIFGRVGGLLGIGGAFAVGGMIGETLQIERNLRRIQYQGSLGAKEMARMRDIMNQVAGNTGKSRAEVVAAIDAANDLGLTLQEAQDHMEQFALWADLVGVSTDQAVGAVASIKRAVGDAASVDEIMAMVNAAAMNAGMDEGVFMNLVSKVGSQLEGMAGIADITKFFQAIAGIGEEFAGDPSVLQSAFKGMNRYMGNAKLMERLNKAGVSGKNASELFLSMAQLLERDSTALDRAQLPDEVMQIVQAMAGNGERINKMGKKVDAATTSVDEFKTRVADHAKDPEVAWAGTMERLKQAMQPLITDVLNWFLINKDGLINVFQSLITVVGGFGAAFAGIVDFFAKITGGPTSAELVKLEEAGQKSEHAGKKIVKIKQRMTQTTDEGERERLAGQMAYWLGQAGEAQVAAGVMSSTQFNEEKERRMRRVESSPEYRSGLLYEAESARLESGGANPIAQAVAGVLSPQNMASAFLRAARGAFTVMVNVSDKVSSEADVRAENREAGALPVAAS